MRMPAWRNGLARWTSNPKVVGSNPTVGVLSKTKIPWKLSTLYRNNVAVLKLSWRTRLARSSGNPKVGSSNPPGSKISRASCVKVANEMHGCCHGNRNYLNPKSMSCLLWWIFNQYVYIAKPRNRVSLPGGLEPPTFRLTVERANQLRHGSCALTKILSTSSFLKSRKSKNWPAS